MITNLKPYTTAYNPSSDTEQILRGTGIDKNSKEYTFILGADKKVITAANDVQVWYVDKDGDISKSSYSSVGTDDNDTFWAVVKDYMVQVLVVEEVAEAPDAEYDLPGVAGVQWKVGNKGFGDEGEPAVAKAGNTIQIKVDPSLKPTLTPAQTLTGGTNGVFEFTMPAASITGVTLANKDSYDGTVVFDTTTKNAVTAEWTGDAKPSNEELAALLIDELVKQGYDKGTAQISALGDSDISIKIKKTINGVAGPEDTYKIDPSTGLTEVRAVASQAELNTALTDASFAGKIKLNDNATLATAPSKDIEVASGKTLTLTGTQSLSKDITGAGKVSTTGTITDGDKILVTGGLTLGASSSIDKVGSIPVTVAGDTTISGVAAPSALTQTEGEITVNGSSAKLTVPAGTALGDVTVTNGQLVLAGNATVAAGKEINIAASKTIDFTSSNFKLTGGTGSKIVFGDTSCGNNFSAANQNFYANDGTAWTGTAVKDETCTWDATLGSNAGGWKGTT